MKKHAKKKDLDHISFTVGTEVSPCNKVKYAVFGTASQRTHRNSLLSQNICATSTEYIDRDTKLKHQFVLHWTVSRVFAPLPLTMSPLLNYASILSSKCHS